MDKYNNLDNSSFKDVYKSDYKSSSASTATAAPAGSGTASSAEGQRLRRTHRSGSGTTISNTIDQIRENPALARRFREMSFMDALEASESMSQGDRADLCSAAHSYIQNIVQSDTEEDEQRSAIEKLFLLAPHPALGGIVIMLGHMIGKTMLKHMEEYSDSQFIDGIPGEFGRACGRLKADYLAALGEAKESTRDFTSILERMEKCQADLPRYRKYAAAMKDRAESLSTTGDWKSGLDEEKQKDILQFAHFISMHFELIVKELDRLEPIMREGVNAIEKLAGSGSVKAKQSNPVDARLTELRKTTPGEVRDKLLREENYRKKSRELLRLAKGTLAKDEVDLFEKLLLLGLQGDELDTALEKVKTSLSGSPKGWMGSEIKDLQADMNKAPTVSSGWGILGGLIVIALFVALAAFLYMEPAVAAFMVGATEVVLAIGMIVCFLVGLAGGFIGAVAAALAWAFVTYLINMVVPIEKALHIIVCILALAPSLFGLGWIMTSTPSARRKDQNAREKHIIDCRKEGEELIEYINDLLVCISPVSSTENGQKAQRYYKAAIEKIRRIKPE